MIKKENVEYLRKFIFFIFILYTITYLVNIVYINKVLHFADWSYLCILLFISSFLFIYEIKYSLISFISLITILTLTLFFRELSFRNYFEILLAKFYSLENLIFIVLLLLNISLKFCFINHKKIENRDILYSEREEEVKFILNFLENKDINTLGIDSEFGTGKTFIIDETIKRINEDEFEIIKIRCLLVETDEMYTYILKKIKKILAKNFIFTTTFEKFKNSLVKSVDNRILGGISELLSPNLSIDEIENFKNIILKLNKSIILIFDDIDRVNDSEKIDKILSFISDFSLPNIRTIVLYNSNNLKKINEKYTRNFLEKYIPLNKELTDISFISLLQKEIEKNNLDEEDFKFLYLTCIEEYKIYSDYNKQISEFKFKYDLSKLVPLTIKTNIKITPRQVKNFINETIEYFSFHNLNIEKRIIIGYSFLKHILYEDFYEKIQNINSELHEIFPINFEVNINNSKVKISLEDLDLIKTLAKKKEDVLYDIKNVNDFSYIDINGKRIFFEDEGYYIKESINTILKKIGYNETKDLSIERKIGLFEKFSEEIFRNDSILSKDTINTFIRVLLNYPLYYNENQSFTDEKREKIEKGIKKLKFLGNKEYLSAAQEFYNLFSPSLKEENINSVIMDFNRIKITDSNNIFLFGVDSFISTMKVLKHLGTSKEQEIFLNAILIKNDNTINDLYVNVFLESDIQNYEVIENLIITFIENKVDIKQENTILSLIKNLKKILFHSRLENNSLSESVSTILKNIRKDLVFEKERYLNISYTFPIIKSTYSNYIRFVNKLEDMLNSNCLNKNSVDVRVSFQNSRYPEEIEKLLNLKNENDKKLELEKLFKEKKWKFKYFEGVCEEVLKKQ